MALARKRRNRKKAAKFVTGTAKKRQIPLGVGTLYTGIPNKSYNAER
jgi:hypothetical protein